MDIEVTIKLDADIFTALVNNDLDEYDRRAIDQQLWEAARLFNFCDAKDNPVTSLQRTTTERKKYNESLFKLGLVLMKERLEEHDREIPLTFDEHFFYVRLQDGNRITEHLGREPSYGDLKTIQRGLRHYYENHK